MAVSPEVLSRVITSPTSPTGRLVAMRKDPGEGPLEQGVWYSNFSRVKAEADKRGLPMFGMWTNGDQCGLCRRFTENLLDEKVQAFLKSSGALLWVGGSMTDDEEDKRGGKGYDWARAHDKVSYFPFVGMYHPVTGLKYGSGGDFDAAKRGAEGAAALLKSITETFATFPKSGTPQKQAQAAQPAAQTGGRRLSIRINPSWDAAHVGRFKDAMERSGGHCLCRADKNSETLCMCKEFMDSDKPGLCGCGVFEKYYA